MTVLGAQGVYVLGDVLKLCFSGCSNFPPECDANNARWHVVNGADASWNRAIIAALFIFIGAIDLKWMQLKQANSWFDSAWDI